MKTNITKILRITIGIALVLMSILLYLEMLTPSQRESRRETQAILNILNGYTNVTKISIKYNDTIFLFYGDNLEPIKEQLYPLSRGHGRASAHGIDLSSSDAYVRIRYYVYDDLLFSATIAEIPFDTNIHGSLTFIGGDDTIISSAMFIDDTNITGSLNTILLDINSIISLSTTTSQEFRELIARYTNDTYDTKTLEKIYNIFTLPDDEITRLYEPFYEVVRDIREQHNNAVSISSLSLSDGEFAQADRLFMAIRIVLGNPEDSIESILDYIEWAFAIETARIAVEVILGELELFDEYGGQANLFVVPISEEKIEEITQNINQRVQEKGAETVFTEAMEVIDSVFGSNFFFDADGNALSEIYKLTLTM